MRTPLRFVPGGRRLVLLAAPVAIGGVALAGAFAYRSSAGAASVQPPPAADPALSVPPQPGLLVDVTGAVENPGLYRLPRGDRVFDAIAVAGGFSPDADMSKLPNLAGRLKDGEQVKVAFAKTASGTTIVPTNPNTPTPADLQPLPRFPPPLPP